MSIMDTLSGLGKEFLSQVNGAAGRSGVPGYVVRSPYGKETHWVVPKGQKLESLCGRVWPSKLARATTLTVSCEVCQQKLQALQKELAQKQSTRSQTPGRPEPQKMSPPRLPRVSKPDVLYDFTDYYRYLRSKVQRTDLRPQYPSDLIFYGLFVYEDEHDRTFYCCRVVKAGAPAKYGLIVMDYPAYMYDNAEIHEYAKVIEQDFYRDDLSEGAYFPVNSLAEAVEKLQQYYGIKAVDKSLAGRVRASQTEAKQRQKDVLVMVFDEKASVPVAVNLLKSLDPEAVIQSDGSMVTLTHYRLDALDEFRLRIIPHKIPIMTFEEPGFKAIHILLHGDAVSAVMEEYRKVDPAAECTSYGHPYKGNLLLFRKYNPSKLDRFIRKYSGKIAATLEG